MACYVAVITVCSYCSHVNCARQVLRLARVQQSPGCASHDSASAPQANRMGVTQVLTKLLSQTSELCAACRTACMPCPN